MTSEMIAAASVVLLLTLLALGGLIGLRAAIRGEQQSRPVWWFDEE